jgi:hypothetical protein
VQLYGDDDASLTRNVAAYVCGAIEHGAAALVVAMPRHVDQVARHLASRGIDWTMAIERGQIVARDAYDMLTRFMLDGQPDAELFERSVGALVWGLAERYGDEPLHVYGEMVGILWQSGQRAAAMRLEALWNKLLGGTRFRLFCGYPIDVASKAVRLSDIDTVLCSHSELVGADSDGVFHGALQRAMREVVGERATSMHRRMAADTKRQWASMPRAEATVLWLRANEAENADEIIARARRYAAPPPTSPL